jgi:DNA replication protein DnaC
MTMPEPHDLQGPAEALGALERHLAYLKLGFIAAQSTAAATQAAQHGWSHVDYLATLVEGEAHVRRDRATTSRIRLARFPVIKTLEQFRWDWPARIKASRHNKLSIDVIGLMGSLHSPWNLSHIVARLSIC